MKVEIHTSHNSTHAENLGEKPKNSWVQEHKKPEEKSNVRERDDEENIVVANVMQQMMGQMQQMQQRNEAQNAAIMHRINQIKQISELHKTHGVSDIIIPIKIR